MLNLGQKLFFKGDDLKNDVMKFLSSYIRNIHYRKKCQLYFKIIYYNYKNS